MFFKNELSLLCNPYFVLLRKTDKFIEVRSVNTGHCWILQRTSYTKDLSVVIHHKHSITDSYYHIHGQAKTVDLSVRVIKKHDNYVLRRREVVSCASH